MAYWSAFYPADTVKTEMQTREAGAAPPKSFFSTFRDIYRTSGIRGLYRGLTPTLMRAMPANAAVFLVYEKATIAANEMLGVDAMGERL